MLFTKHSPNKKGSVSGLRGIPAALLVAVLSIGTGCVDVKHPPPAAELRKQFGTIGVTGSSSGYDLVLDEPTARSAARGALEGAFETPHSGSQGPFGAILALLFPPVGASAGASAVHSEEEIAAASASLQSAIADLDLPGTLVDRVVKGGRDLEGFDILPLAADDAATDELGLGRGTPSSVLDIGVARFDFALNRDEVQSDLFRQDLDFVIEVGAHLYRTTDKALLFWRVWRYRSPSHDYFALADADAKLFRAESESAIQIIAGRIVHDLFVATGSEVQQLGMVQAGTVRIVRNWSRGPSDEPLSVAPSEAPPFGAIAVSTSGPDRWAACIDRPNQRHAEVCALSRCGDDCKLGVTFGAGQCAAGAVRRVHPDASSEGDDARVADAHGFGIGTSSDEAVIAALEECYRSPNEPGTFPSCGLMIEPECNESVMTVF